MTILSCCKLLVEQLYFLEILGVDGGIVQPVGFEDAELLQARASCFGDSVAEVAWAVESNAVRERFVSLSKMS